MKQILTCIFAILTSSLLAQNISLDELLNLRTRNVASVEEYLTAKGWDLLSTKKEEETSFGLMIFAYKKSNYSDKAESFIKYLYSESANRKRISMQIVKKEKYTNFLNQIKAKGASLVSSKIEDDYIRKVYKNKSLSFIVTTSTQAEDFSGTKTTYNIFIVTNDDYIINLSDD